MESFSSLMLVTVFISPPLTKEMLPVSLRPRLYPV